MTCFSRVGLIVAWSVCAITQIGSAQELRRDTDVVRVATYNVALNRRAQGELSKELAKGESKSVRAIAEVIQRVRPDILLINELDYDEGKSLELFHDKFLAVGQNGLQPLTYEYRFTAPVNTGVDSGISLDGNTKKGEPNDAFGFGRFPGQYGMAVLSRLKIDRQGVRTFQNFLWKDMPNRAKPIDPKTKKAYYSDQVMDVFRLSSKSHWDIPIQLGDHPLHLIACHPTPPVFDGAEDRNGCRNFDEIRLCGDYVSGAADYLYDDKGVRGGLGADAHFVIAGDLNADPNDGDSREGAIEQLLKNSRINAAVAPESTGGKFWAEKQAGANKKHQGNPAQDTSDFSDSRVGNMRIDYVLPSKTLKVVGSGVFWPKTGEDGAAAAQQSDHRLVWIDIRP